MEFLIQLNMATIAAFVILLVIAIVFAAAYFEVSSELEVCEVERENAKENEEVWRKAWVDTSNRLLESEKAWEDISNRLSESEKETEVQKGLAAEINKGYLEYMDGVGKMIEEHQRTLRLKDEAYEALRAEWESLGDSIQNLVNENNLLNQKIKNGDFADCYCDDFSPESRIDTVLDQ